MVVYDVGAAVNGGEEEDGVGDDLMKGDTGVKGNDAVERGGTKEGDERTTDGEEEKGHADVQVKGGGTSKDQRSTQENPGTLVIVRESVICGTDKENENLREDPNTEKDEGFTIVDHPRVEAGLEFLKLIPFGGMQAKASAQRGDRG